MDTTGMSTAAGAHRERVRDQVRDALAVMGFSAGASAVMATGLVLLGRLAG